MDEFGTIDTEPPPAVKSLRSRFEQLAKKPYPNSISSPRLNGNSDFLNPGGPSSPRQRSTSGTFTHLATESELHPHPHLRSASSSSDLQFGIHRLPPPPPSRGPNGTTSSPVPSPFLRPVPIPLGVSNGNGLMPSPRLGYSTLPLINPDQEVLESVASLRGKL